MSFEAAALESRKSGFPDEKKSMMAAKTSGFRKSQDISSVFVTVIKSDPKKTRVTPALSHYYAKL